MSSVKKRKAADVKSTLKALRETLLQLKPLLHDPASASPSTPSACALLTHLHAATSGAADLTALLARGRETLEERDADELDAVGVGLWNGSAEWRERGAGGLFGKARAAAFALIECGREAKPGVEGLVRLLELGAKAASALSAIGDVQDAEGVLMKCATYEDALSKLPVSVSYSESRQRAKAHTTYFRVRAENNFHRAMLEPAWFMMRKACDDYRLSLLSPRDVHPLMALSHQVGTSLLASKPDENHPGTGGERAKRAGTAVDWLTLGLRLGEQSDRELGGGEERERRTYTGGKIRNDIMLALARAYIAASPADPEHLERAEATLDEILTNRHADGEEADLRRARWLRLQCALQRKAGDAQVVDVFSSVIEHDTLSDTLVNRVIKTVLHGKVALSRHVVTKILQRLLLRVLRPPAPPSATPDGAPSELLVTVVMSILIHLKSEETAHIVCRELKAALDAIKEAGWSRLIPAGCKACQMIVWQMGDGRYGAVPPKHAEAVLFYELSLHPALQPSASDSAMVHRKTALCHILLQDYERAAEAIACCNPNEGATCYLQLLSYINQGLEEPAVAAVKALVQCDDLDTKLLLLATQLATDANFPNVLLEALDSLLGKVREGAPDLAGTSSLVIVRCLVRLTAKQLESVHAERDTLNLSETLVRHFRTAVEIATQQASDAQTAPDEKELLWLYKQAYNSAVNGTRAGWGEGVLYGLFEAAVAFMDLYAEVSLTPSDDVQLHRVLASYASCVARYIQLRDLHESEDEKSKLRAEVLRRSRLAFDALLTLLDRKPPLSSASALREISQTMRVLQVSCYADGGDWSGAEAAVDDALARGGECSESTFECIAQLVWSHSTCPADVATRILDRLLNASLDLDLIPTLDRFSRWMRTAVSLLLGQSTSESTAKALEHVNEAVDVQRAHAGKTDMSYPQDESDWLIAVCATEAQKDSATANLARAKAWYEAALALLPFASWGEGKAGKLRARYSDLLARIGSSTGS